MKSRVDYVAPVVGFWYVANENVFYQSRGQKLSPKFQTRKCLPQKRVDMGHDKSTGQVYFCWTQNPLRNNLRNSRTI